MYITLICLIAVNFLLLALGWGMLKRMVQLEARVNGAIKLIDLVGQRMDVISRTHTLLLGMLKRLHKEAQ